MRDRQHIEPSTLKWHAGGWRRNEIAVARHAAGELITAAPISGVVSSAEIIKLLCIVTSMTKCGMRSGIATMLEKFASNEAAISNKQKANSHILPCLK